MKNDDKKTKARRRFLAGGLGAAALGALAQGSTAGRRADRPVWQLDPYLCSQCGRCATECVLKPSAVKCVHAYAMCGYCELCFGYFLPGARSLDESAENQTCPTGAIRRRFIEEPYFEYVIDEPLCIGCAKCVTGCNTFGNGSLFLQVRHDRCLNCNECAIAAVCPADAFVRVSASRPYIFKGENDSTSGGLS